MARILEERTEVTEDQKTQETLEEETTLEQEQQEQQETTEEQEVPQKYQGKSTAEIIRMHQEAEKLLGKQSSEVGELRKVVDDYIQTQLSEQAPQQQQEAEQEDIDFFSDPDKAVARAIDNHPKIKEAEQISSQYRQSTAMAELQRRHPDMQSILQDNKFAEWIKGSKIRQQLFVQADQQYDYEAADELFNTWKERQQVVGQTAASEKTERKKAVKAASTGNVRGSGEQSAKKVYRRSDIIKLMKEDPERYMSLSNEIMAAYADGRVRQ
jgi:hypothetical protein